MRALRIRQEDSLLLPAQEELVFQLRVGLIAPEERDWYEHRLYYLPQGDLDVLPSGRLGYVRRRNPFFRFVWDQERNPQRTRYDTARNKHVPIESTSLLGRETRQAVERLDPIAQAIEVETILRGMQKSAKEQSEQLDIW